ncbi:MULTISPECIES: APC family permease [Flavobacteriaceae]|uniref:APC family permease n=1 Tax=Flavobacteriaceae TaxID=49546 RepID=UPI001303AE77|nr:MULTISPECIES: APC family permease [Flavobacteriaceae]MDM1534261.1 amino acid permease [Myroides marinus]MDM1541244.1 amino acid permease [Myroides marinus]MEC4113328.1 APC family permease [Myroides pelagicus]NLP59379.1 amino acid permease [Lutibacter sp. B1]
MENELKRELKTPGAILMGLGSIVGTGIFVSIAIATQIAGSGIIIAVVIAAVLAAFNGLSSAQLAAAHSVSGGTYEYGNRFLNSYFGFAAGWMFLIAKSASAATAVLGCVGYLFYAFGVNADNVGIVGAGLLLLFVMTLLVSGGIRRSNQANIIIVSATLLGLAALVIVSFFVKGFPVQPIVDSVKDTSITSILYGSALMFVAYTGYGRIATLGEEVSEPRTTIPKAIILAMVIIVILYLAVSLTAINVMGAEAFGLSVEGKAAPLMLVAQSLSVPVIGSVITIAAITAMLGVVLNLLLGLSRVILSMARRKDLPAKLSKINHKTQSPAVAVWVTGGIIGVLVLSGDVVFTWSFSAFTVLIYYAITNLAALRMPADLRLYPRWIPAFGLFGCLFLAFWIEPTFWIGGLALLGVGLIWHSIALKLKSRNKD